jgi:hypothetical protein
VTGWLAWAYANRQADFTTRISYDTQANSVFTSGAMAILETSGGQRLADCGPAIHGRTRSAARPASTRRLEYYSRSRTPAFRVAAAQTFDGLATASPTLFLGATWLPSRNWQVNCSLTLNDRNQRRDSGRRSR